MELRLTRIWPVFGTFSIAALVTGFMLLSTPAGAQANTTSRMSRPVVGQSNGQAKQEPLPPAVPGSKPNDSGAAPNDHANLDMPPTEALFDSINRGDLAGVKDAIGRGADLEGHNVLGMSPLDLSVDLGRNEISFLLLSLRGGDTSPTRVTSSSPLPTPTQKDARAARTTRSTPPREAVLAPAAPRTAQLFAGGGGTPVPTAGFLGFGGSKAQ